MIITDEGRELAMELLCAMTVEDIAEEDGQDVFVVYKRFRRSKTFNTLFDGSTGLWMNGPVYVAGEYREFG